VYSYMGATALAPPTRSGFDECYHVAYAGLTAQLTAYLADAAEAEDVVQEAFLRAWQRWAVVSVYEDPVAWVRRVAWNLATSRWRRLKRETRLLRHHQVSRTALLGPDNVALVSALGLLRPNLRRVIVMHYLTDMPVSEIAADLGRPRGTILSWLYRGRAQLSALLQDNEGE
jgi:RNA polymerase sigma-70 factor, ECF subfamily